MLFGMRQDAAQRCFSYREMLGGPCNVSSQPSTFTSTEDLSMQTASSRQVSTKQGNRTCWSDGEVKILITVYSQEYEQRHQGKSLDAMWDRIAERVNSESVEINAFSGEKTAKNCHDKMNNLNKKYKTVKDKSKSTGEGSDEIKSFPKFTDLDELWGTRDTVTNKYVVEAGSNDEPIDETSTEGSDHDQSEEEDLSFDAPLSSSLRRKRKQPLKEAQTAPPLTPVHKRKRTTMSNEASSSASSSSTPSPPPQAAQKGKKGTKSKQRKAVADEDEDAFREFLKVQTEYTKRREEERAELFSYLKKSDEQTHQLMISAIRELGEVLKGGNSSKNP